MLFEDPEPSLDKDLFGHQGRQIILGCLKDAASKLPGRPQTASSIEVAITNFLDRANSPSVPQSRSPVGILGAGASGLYVALILSDLDIPFEVIEARDHKVGGRLYTHTFPNKTGAPYNYFEVGAMRFPDHIAMRRVFHLFDYPPLNEGGLALAKKKRPYYFEAVDDNGFLSYNDFTYRQNAVPASSEDPFDGMAVISDVSDPKPFITAGPSAIFNDVIKEFADGLYYDLKNNTHTGWDNLMRFEHHSARSYMSTVYLPNPNLSLPEKPLTNDVVNWCETFENSTGSFDRSFSEVVLEAIAFGWTPSESRESEQKKLQWYCIDGGASEITDTMYTYLLRRHPNSFKFNNRAIAIRSYVPPSSSPQDIVLPGIRLPEPFTLDPLVQGSTRLMEVTTDHGNRHTYSHLITTIPLPVLRTVDTRQAGLSPMQSNALRELTYGPAIKVGMQFRTAWWTTATTRKGEKLNIVGGQSFTDTPLRTVVYPSFGDVAAGKTTTLIASYCWTDDAERLSALCRSTDEADKAVLREMVLRELAFVHDLSIEFLREQLIDTFAWSWSQDPYTMGAFAFFGPGKFLNLYKSLTLTAADGHLHFGGEALSTRHAWVEGAFDSAWRAVHGLLAQPGFTPEQREKFFRNWGRSPEWSDAASIRKPMPKTGERLDVERLFKESLLVQHLAVAEAGGYGVLSKP